MKALFIGGIKSGKSRLAEEYTCNSCTTKPYYLATTDFIDTEMHQRIAEHKQQREDRFITLEEPLALTNTITNIEGTVLVECVSMWINNMLYHKRSQEAIFAEIHNLLKLKHNIVFVLNDVGSGIIPQNALAREFVDVSGKVSQILAAECEEVFHVIAGIGVKIK